MKADLELRIEELVLEGFAPGDRRRVAAAVESELTRLFAERGVPPLLEREGGIPRLDGGRFALTPGARPEAAGAAVARAVYRGMRDGHQDTPGSEEGPRAGGGLR